MLSETAWNIAAFLATSVRVAEVGQIARIFCSGELAQAEQALQKLEGAGWAESVSVLIPEVMPLSKPLYTWRRRPPGPNTGAMEWIAEKRVRALSVVEKRVYFASIRGARRIGGFGGFRAPHQCWHDLMLSACYECLSSVLLDLSGRWLSEDCYKRDFPGRPAPDAMILDAGTGQPCLAVDVVGPSYGATGRLKKFHEDFRWLAYQLW